MPDKRNIVLILCDQLRPDFISPYGADFVKTPNMDKLADNGVVFDNAITASTVCVPARASIMTGLHVSGHGSWTNDMPCKDGLEYVAERMNANGYLTAAVGVFDHPPVGNRIGFQYLEPISLDPDGQYVQKIRERYPDVKTWCDTDETGHFKYPEEFYYDRWSCDRATDFINSYAKNGCAPDGTKPENNDAPFLLYCGFFTPHAPWTPPHGVEDMVDVDKIPPVLCTHREDISSVEKYRRAFLNTHEELVNPEGAVAERMKLRTRYCEMIAEIDTLVGRIVDSLKENGLYENTTIIFTSDHGSVEHDYNETSKGPWPYHSQLFVPMIMSNHPRLDAGTHCDALCGNLDFGATALDIAGDDKAFGISRSMIGLADGSIEEREVNMSEFSDAIKTIVDKRYTFSYYPFEGMTILYDRIKDHEERVNLSGKPEYTMLEQKFLGHIIDFMCLAKGLRLETHDVTPEIKEGIQKKDPGFLDKFDIAFPLASWEEYDRVAKAGLDADYNEFARNREIKAHYGVYFLGESPENFL